MPPARHIDIQKSTSVRFPRLVGGLTRLAARLAPKTAARLFADRFLTPFKVETPERELDWVRGAQRHVVRCGDYRLAVSSLGLGGPQVLLVHGWSGRGSQLGAFIEPLLAAGFEVNWFDLPAHGQSSGSRSGLVHAVEAVQAVTAWLGGAHTVVAHSMGAAAATLAAARGADIGRMAYISPPDDVGSFLHAVGETIGLPDSVVVEAQRAIEGRFGTRFDDLIPTEVAPGMTQPLLAIHDRDDREVSLEEVERLTRVWPDARLVVTEGLGHRRILRDPDVVRQVVEFAARQRSALAA